MYGLMWRGSSVAVMMVLGACSAPSEGPNCSSETAQSVLKQVLWESVEQQISASAGAQNAQPFMDLAQANMKIEVNGITTTEASKDVRQVRCQATMSSTLPEVPNADFSLLRTAIAREPGNVRLEGLQLTGPVEYRVQLSDDGGTTRVEARGFRTFTEVLGGVTSALYINEAQEKARAAETVAKAHQSAQAIPSTPVTPRSTELEAREVDPRALAADEYQTADKLLNEAYQAARASMGEAQRTALRHQQREWIKSRDATCSAERIEADSKGEIAGGSVMELAIVGCKIRMTSERAQQLSALKS